MLTEGFVWRQKEREVVFRPRVQNGFGAKSDYSGKAYPVAIFIRTGACEFKRGRRPVVVQIRPIGDGKFGGVSAKLAVNDSVIPVFVVPVVVPVADELLMVSVPEQSEFKV